MEANLRWPSVFRKRHKEQDLVTFFVQRAGMYTNYSLPRSPAQWLSLMQHVGLPTRLLDWSDSALVFFAVNSEASIDAAVWMLDPIELNKLSNIVNLPASFTEPVVQSYNVAFSANPKNIPKFPIAVFPTNVHKRLAVQRGCFTIRGSDKRSFVAQFEQHPFSDDGRLVKLRVPANARHSLRKQLALLGIKYATLFPDLDGLARELADTF